MSDSLYFVLTSDEDGLSIKGMTAENLRRYLDPANVEHEGRLPPVILPSLPRIDRGCFMADDDVVVIIKGEIVVPKPTQVVTRYEIP